MTHEEYRTLLCHISPDEYLYSQKEVIVFQSTPIFIGEVCLNVPQFLINRGNRHKNREMRYEYPLVFSIY